MGQYIKQVYDMGVGGGEDATVVELRDGKVIVLAFDMVGVYDDIDHYLEGGEAPITAPAGLYEIAVAEPQQT